MTADGWRSCTLGDVIELKRGYDLPSSERRPGPVPILSSSGVSGWHDEAKVQAPGVVTGRYGTIGQVFFVGEDFWPLNTTLYVRDFKGNDERFISYFLRSLDFQAFNDKSSVPGLNRNDLHRYEIVVPEDVDDQRAIAAVLGSLDDKIEQNRRTSRTLEQAAQAIFRAWFVDFEPVKAKAEGATSFPSVPQDVFDTLPTRFVDSEIGPVPDGWGVKALSCICELISGGTPRRSEPTYWGGDIPWYSVKDAPADGEVWVISTSESISREGVANSAAKVVPKGCTIISARGTVGRLALVGAPMAFNQSCYGLLPEDGQSTGYFHLLMQSVVRDLKQRTHGSVFDTITRATFDGVIVTSPPKHLLSAFEAVASSLLELLLALKQESTALATMRDELQPKLLSGKIRVEASDA